MFLHGKSCNETIYRDSEILGRTKSLAKHIRDPDKNGDLFRDSINMDIEESYRRTTQEEYSPKRDKTRSEVMDPVSKDNLFVHRFPLMPNRVNRPSDYRDYAKSHSSLLRRTYWNNSKRRTLNDWRYHTENNETQRKKFKSEYFKPASWSKASREIEDITYNCRDYYLAEKDKKYSEWIESKNKWMGAPFIAGRKKGKDSIPKCKNVGSTAYDQFIGNRNKYEMFTGLKDSKRYQILNNFKEIARVINKNFIK